MQHVPLSSLLIRSQPSSTAAPRVAVTCGIRQATIAIAAFSRIALSLSALKQPGVASTATTMTA